MATKRRWRRLLAVLLTLALMCSLSVQAFAASLPADAGTAEEETVSADMKAAAAALMEQRKAAGLVKADLDDLDPDATIRVMVETKATPAVQAAGTMEWNARTQQAEMQALRKQESVAAQVEKITGNGILNQSAFLVSTFTTEMTVAEMEEVAALPDVVSVTPVTTFEMKMNYATSMTTVTKMWEELGYTGEGTVIAVIDSGATISTRTWSSVTGWSPRSPRRTPRRSSTPWAMASTTARRSPSATATAATMRWTTAPPPTACMWRASRPATAARMASPVLLRMHRS